MGLNSSIARGNDIFTHTKRCPTYAECILENFTYYIVDEVKGCTKIFLCTKTLIGSNSYMELNGSQSDRMFNHHATTSFISTIFNLMCSMCYLQHFFLQENTISFKQKSLTMARKILILMLTSPILQILTMITKTSNTIPSAVMAITNPVDPRTSWSKLSMLTLLPLSIPAMLSEPSSSLLYTPIATAAAIRAGRDPNYIEERKQ